MCVCVLYYCMLLCFTPSWLYMYVGDSLSLSSFFSLVRAAFSVVDDSSEDECLLSASLQQHFLSGTYGMLYCGLLVDECLCVLRLYATCHCLCAHCGVSDRLVFFLAAQVCIPEACKGPRVGIRWWARFLQGLVWMSPSNESQFIIQRVLQWGRAQLLQWSVCLLTLKSCNLNLHMHVSLYTGWWSKDLVCSISPSSPALWSSSVMYICSGNSLAQRVCVCVRACMAISIVKHLLQGCLHLAVGRYRQCLLQSPGFSLCTVAAVANTALLFQMMSNVDAELEARIVLLKVCVTSYI